MCDKDHHLPRGGGHLRMSVLWWRMVNRLTGAPFENTRCGSLAGFEDMPILPLRKCH